MIAWFLLLGVALAQGLGDFMSPGPLAAVHGHLAGVTQCPECHTPGQGPEPARCMKCHDRVKAQVDGNTGFHATKTACADCHPDHRGRDTPLASFDDEQFNHGVQTGFSLQGQHRWLACTDCHTKGEWGGMETRCATCHIDPHVQAGNPRPTMALCEGCHNETDWKRVTVPAFVLDHTDADQVDYVLRGAHVDVGCIDCHVDAVFVPTVHEACTSCHKDPHRAPFSDRCEDCHSVKSWVVRPFAHDQTGYPLEGLHSDVACNNCHRGSAVDRLRHDSCKDCHLDPHLGQFDPRPCDTCHSVNVARFGLAEFDHRTTDFPLEGEHVDVPCADCHGGGPAGTYATVAHEDCVACHEDTHLGRFAPTPCKVCHNASGWGVEDFDHDTTDFPLTGEHVDVTCETCHPDGKWSGVAHDTCAACHTQTPHGPSVAACVTCHTTTAFTQITFDHVAQTGFDLEPQHGDAGCLACHLTADAFTGRDAACTACHHDTRPSGHYPGECTSCHAGAGWVPADLGDADHALTGFPLVGSHALLLCDDCHTTAAYGAAEPVCRACHADDDVHRGLLGPNCDDCHTEIAWFRTRFRHQSTGWPLRGAHRLAACVDCHAVAFAGTPQDCRVCHEQQAPLDVAAHRSVFFSQCDTCHRPYTWAAFATGSTP